MKDKWRFWLYRIKTVRKDLFYGFIVAVASVLAIDLWLIKITEFFPLGAEFGSIYYKICFGYITAFIFFFINVHLQNHKMKVKTLRYVSNKTARLYSGSLDLIIALKNANNIKNENYDIPSLEEIEDLCKRINPHFPMRYGPLGTGFQNWFDFFQFMEDETKRSIKDLLDVKDALDTELLRLITNLDDCVESHLNSTRGLSVGNQDLEFRSRSIYQYRSLCGEISIYLRTNYKVYSEEYHFLERLERKSKMESTEETKNKKSK